MSVMAGGGMIEESVMVDGGRGMVVVMIGAGTTDAETTAPETNDPETTAPTAPTAHPAPPNPLPPPAPAKQ